jgi:hypothetical protein
MHTLSATPLFILHISPNELPWQLADERLYSKENDTTDFFYEGKRHPRDEGKR